MSSRRAAVLGLDLGTGGARVLIVAEDGEMLASGAAKIEGAGRAASGEHEQDPEAWWSAARTAIGAATSELARRAGPTCELRAMSIDGTSGTIVGVDEAGNATTPALMYDDSRATQEARELEAQRKSGASVSATSGLAKMRWLERHRPREFAATHLFAHQADFIAARVTGEVGLTDSSNALKSGYDLATNDWARWIDDLPELRSKLPLVIESGQPLGAVRDGIANELGLPAGLVVVAGATDGTAAFLASGASEPGEDNTTLGTTLVFKRVARREVRDAEGLLYCHRLPGRASLPGEASLPGGVWLPGAASNVGGGWIRQSFGAQDLAELDARAAEMLPAPHLAYPLHATGERFPFRDAAATSFCIPPTANAQATYAANLQGTAFVERLAYEKLDDATGAASRVHAVFATGGGARSDVWTQLRADVCSRVYHCPATPESAFGSAILAAGHALFDDVWQASRAMVRIERSFQPDPLRARVYDEYYARFRAELVRRGYLTN